MSAFLVIGGAHVDLVGRIAGETHLNASNPGRWERRPGGAGLNAAITLSALGNTVRLIAPRGGDGHGELVGRAVIAAGITDTPLTFLDRQTPTYSAIVDRDGDLVIALADMALYDAVSPRQFSRRTVREAIASADHILTDANLPRDALVALTDTCARHHRRPSAIAVSPAKVLRLLTVLPHLDVLFMNEREARSLLEATGQAGKDRIAGLRALGLRRAVVTDGGNPLLVFDENGAWSINPPSPRAIVDVTGAGDALAAATLNSRSAGSPLHEACRHGIAASLTALECEAPAPPIDDARLSTRLAEVPDPQPLRN